MERKSPWNSRLSPARAAERSGKLSAMAWPTAVELAREVAARELIIPDEYVATFEADMALVVTAIAQHGSEAVGALLDRPESAHRCGRLIADAAGLDRLSVFTSLENADRLHRIRNTLASIVGLVAYDLDLDPTVYMRKIPRVQRRGTKNARPFTHDEIVLGRIGAIHSITESTRYNRKAGGHWLLGEIGLRPAETCLFTDEHIDNLDTPSTVRAPGLTRGVRVRTLSLDHFARRNLMHLVQASAGHPTGSRLVFDGDTTTSNHKLSANGSRILDHFFDTLSLNEPTLTAGSLSKYRASLAARDGQEGRARDLRGATSCDRALEQLHVPVDYDAQADALADKSGIAYGDFDDLERLLAA